MYHCASGIALQQQIFEDNIGNGWQEMVWTSEKAVIGENVILNEGEAVPLQLSSSMIWLDGGGKRDLALRKLTSTDFFIT